MSTKPKKDLLMSSKRLLGLLESGSFGFPSDHWIIKDLKEAILEEEENRKTGKYSPTRQSETPVEDFDPEEVPF